MISFKQLYEGLVSGEIKIDENGHDPFYGWGSAGLLDSMKHKIEYWDNVKSYKEIGVTWSDSIVTENHRSTDKHIFDIDKGSPCHNCGEDLVWIYNHDEKKIVCVIGNFIHEGNVDNWYYEYEENICKQKENTPQSFTFEVKENVIFANFFRDQMKKLDEEEKKRKYDYFSLCNTAGLKRVCEFHAKHNIGFQQTTNTSVDIYLSNDSSEILVIEDKYINIENENKTDDEDDNYIESCAEKVLPTLGYKYYGNISCDMWRYMFANISDASDIGGESIIISPKVGKYIATNYFCTTEHETHKIGNFTIASRIIFKK